MIYAGFKASSTTIPLMSISGRALFISVRWYQINSAALGAELAYLQSRPVTDIKHSARHRTKVWQRRHRTDDQLKPFTQEKNGKYFTFKATTTGLLRPKKLIKVLKKRWCSTAVNTSPSDFFVKIGPEIKFLKSKNFFKSNLQHSPFSLYVLDLNI